MQRIDGRGAGMSVRGETLFTADLEASARKKGATYDRKSLAAVAALYRKAMYERYKDKYEKE